MSLLRFSVRGLAALALYAALAAAPAHAGARPPDDNPRSTLDPSVTRIDEARHLGQPLARETAFVDAQGRRFAMGELLGKPLVLVLSYYGCDGACPTVNQNLAAGLAQVTRFQPGRDYHVLTVSFDAKDTAASAAAFVDKMRGLPPALRDGWRFAVLGDAAEGAQQRFAGQVGFNYFWSRIDKMFVHPNAVVFLTPEGRVARYLYGTRLDAKTLQLALIDADWGRISESGAAVFDMITGACFSYNYSEGRYQPNVALFAGVGALLFGLSMMAAGVIGYRRKTARRLVHAP